MIGMGMGMRAEKQVWNSVFMRKDHLPSFTYQFQKQGRWKTGMFTFYEARKHFLISLKGNESE